MKSCLGIYLFIFTFSITSVQAKDYYWVGGSGNWSDLSHWRLSSGGNNQPSTTPSANDNVFFDENSFTANGQKVTITDPNVYCRDLTISTSRNNIVFESEEKTNVNIYGQVNVSKEVSYKFLGDITLAGQSNDRSIDFNSELECARLIFDLDGSRSLVMKGTVLCQDKLYLKNGDVVFEDMIINANRVALWPNRKSKLDLGSSEIIIFGASEKLRSPITEYSGFSIRSQNLELEGSKSTIGMTFSGLNAIYVSGDDPIKLGNLSLEGRQNEIYPQNTSTEISISFNLLEVSNRTLLDGVLEASELRMSSGTDLKIRANGTHTFNKITAIGDCLNHISMSTNKGGSAATVKADETGGMSYCAIQDLILEGNITASNSVLLGKSAGWTVTGDQAIDYYWIGGGGNWSDPKHWSTSSGGTAGNCIPSIKDNVIFDDKSFSAEDQIVEIDKDVVFCKNMTWRDLQDSIILRGQFFQKIIVGASITLHGKIKNEFSGNVEFKSSFQDNVITSNGFIFNQSILFEGDAIWRLSDECHLKHQAILISGHLIFNGHRMICHDFRSGGGKVILDINDSVLETRLYRGYGSQISFHPIDFDLRASSGTIYMRNTTYLAVQYNSTFPQDKTADLRIHKIINLASVSSIVSNVTNIGYEIDSLLCYGDIKSRADIDIGYAYFEPGITYSIEGDKDLSIEQLVAEGTCEKMITIRNVDLWNAKLELTKDYTFNRLQLKGIEFLGGHNYQARSSIDLGGNKNIDIDAIGGRKLYWVGNLGAWDDPMHWSLTSGGTPGECPPNILDTVIVDDRSITEDNVNMFSISSGKALFYCKDFIWTNKRPSTFHFPTLTIAGNLQINSPELNSQYSSFEYLSLFDEENTIDFNDHRISHQIINAKNDLKYISDYQGSHVDHQKGKVDYQKIRVQLFSMFINSGDLDAGDSEIIFKRDNPTTYHNLQVSQNARLVGKGNTIRFSGKSGNARLIGFTDIDNLIFELESGIGRITRANRREKEVRVNSLRAVGNMFISGNMTFNEVILGAGYRYEFDPNAQYTINNYLQLKGNNCLKSNLLSSISGSKAVFSMPKEANMDVDFVEMQDMKGLGGADFFAGNYSTDIGSSNVDWRFGTPDQGTEEVGVLGQDIYACKGSDVVLNDINTLGGNSFKWYNTNGNSVISTDASLKINESGTYWADIQFTDACAIKDTIVVNIEDLSLTLGPDATFCDGTDYTITPNILNNQGVYAWNDGSSVQEKLVTESGEYTLELKLGSCDLKDTILVTKIAAPTFDINGGDDFCLGDTLRLDLTNFGQQYLWSTNSQNATEEFVSSGQYWAEVRSSMCSFRDSFDLVFQLPPEKPSQTLYALCPKTDVMIDYRDLAAEVIWPDGQNDKLRSFSFQSDTTMVLTLKESCTTQFDLKFELSDTATFTMPKDTILCLGDVFAANITHDGDSLMWGDGNGDVVRQIQETGQYDITFFKNGCKSQGSFEVGGIDLSPYNLLRDTSLCDGDVWEVVLPEDNEVQVVWQDSMRQNSLFLKREGLYNLDVSKKHCSLQQQANISLKPIPRFELGPDTTLCPGTSHMLMISAAHSSAIWDDGSTASLRDIDTEGTYGLTLNLDGCEFYDDIVVDILPEMEIDLGRDTVLCQNMAYTLEVTSPFDSLVWSNGNTASTLEVGNGGMYAVKGFFGPCQVMDTVNIERRECHYLDLDIPNVFSPDQNGYNDEFTFVLADDQIEINKFNMQIADKWGNIVWQTEDPNKGWDGMTDGRKASSGLYIYYLKMSIVDDDGPQDIMEKGDVLLIR